MTRLPAASLRLERRVAGYAARFEALRPRERVFLMLSGGADSMALLALLPAVFIALYLALISTTALVLKTRKTGK